MGNNFCYSQVFCNNKCYNFIMIGFKERLKELRTERNISQQELGEIVNVSKMAVSHWEKGHSEPSISQLIILAEFFGVTTDYLIGKTEL